MLFCAICTRNQAYQTRIQLAVLDYNAHLCRDKSVNKEGIEIYSCKFRKQTKKWDATPVLECKKYPHISRFQTAVELEYQQRDKALRSKVQSPYDHPVMIKKTIGNSQPVSTCEIVQRKCSRF